MERDTIAPQEKVTQLKTELAEHYKNESFLNCKTMGEIVRTSLKVLSEEFVDG